MPRLIPAHTLAVFLSSILMLTATAKAQTTWYVDDDAPNDPGPGDPTVGDPNENGTPEHPFDAIQEGIDAAVNGDTVLVLDGMYTGDGNRDMDYGGKLITVRSENGPETCIIDCDGSSSDPHRGFYLHSDETADAVVMGFTILDECESGDPNTLERSGGAILLSLGCSPTIRDCTLAGNQAFLGGGGMSIDSSSPTVVNCNFANNSAGRYGGGVLNAQGSPTIINCTFSGNTAGWDGGGVCCYSSSPTLTNCTFSGNSATGAGGGLYNPYGNPTLTNCIMWGDTPDEIDGGTVVTYSDVQGGWPGEGNIDADPLFVDPNNGDHHLSPGSSCIDAGNNDAVPVEITTDLDGYPRFVDDPGMPDDGFGTAPIVDMGAYEFQGETCFGDLDGDDDIDLADLATLLTHYGTTGTVYTDGDLDRDEDVDSGDLSRLLSVYATTCE